MVQRLRQLFERTHRAACAVSSIGLTVPVGRVTGRLPFISEADDSEQVSSVDDVARIVVDTSYLKCAELEEFLSRANARAVITPVVYGELMRANTIENLRLELAVLSKYPDRVEATHSLRTLMAKSLTRQTDLICPGTTRMLRRLLCSMNEPDETAIDEARALYNTANDAAADAHARTNEDTCRVLNSVALSFGLKALRSFRQTGQLSGAMCMKVLEFAGRMSDQYLTQRFPEVRHDDAVEVYTSLSFRVALGHICWMVHKLKDGARSVSAEDAYSDFRDTLILSLASYFYGVMSTDFKSHVFLTYIRTHLKFIETGLRSEAGMAYVPRAELPGGILRRV